MIRTTIRLFAFCFMVVRYMFFASIVFLTTKDKWQRNKKLALLVQRHSKQALWYLNIKLEIQGEPLAQNHLQVGNHMSYIDVFLMASIHPTSFVTSVEMRDTPILGHMCRLGGCVFVERRNKQNLKNEISEITEALKNGLTITIFPEATSTNGDEVIRFRRPLYNAAIESQKPIQPFCIEYVSIDGKPVTKANRDELCWYGNMTFAGHVINVLSKRDIIMRVKFLEPIYYEAEKDVEHFVSLSYERVTYSYSGFSSLDSL